ncbi:MAG: 6-bladed beta-propeller, partial [Actinomycetota bacterium]
IYVMDPFHSSVQIFNDKGKKLTELGEFGTKEGQFNYPSDIVYMGNRLFAITDTYNNRVQIVRIILR